MLTQYSPTSVVFTQACCNEYIEAGREQPYTYYDVSFQALPVSGFDTI